MFIFKSNWENKMSKSAIKMTETLMLRRIDPISMIKRYFVGDFKSTDYPKNSVKISSSFVNLDQKIGENPTSKIYRFKDKTNSGQVVVTTNHKQYTAYKTGIKTKNICLWSRREIKGEPIGIPVAMETDRHTKETAFWIEDTYYDFSCALAALKRIYLCHHMYKDPLYMDAEQLLHCMYYRMYPDRIGNRIKEAQNWRLLDINGGPLTNDEYNSEECSYVSIPNISMIPVKRQYIKLSAKN
uniref:A1L transcription factor/late transcription factor VLTF-2 n=1 Tax=Pithovirus LCPAC302 TaxID=2506593 RepID=A0A481Z761_9VIRU|nr:MAG: A1L transcription factor/late transcription factor VLTF-2 [Pithovirus LCPAC302]